MDHLTLEVIRDRHTNDVLLKLELHFCTAFFTTSEVLELVNELSAHHATMRSWQPKLKGKTYRPSISSSKER